MIGVERPTISPDARGNVRIVSDPPFCLPQVTFVAHLTPVGRDQKRQNRTLYRRVLFVSAGSIDRFIAKTESISPIPNAPE
jgi:hypothetical protein